MLFLDIAFCTFHSCSHSYGEVVLSSLVVNNATGAAARDIKVKRMYNPLIDSERPLRTVHRWAPVQYRYTVGLQYSTGTPLGSSTVDYIVESQYSYYSTPFVVHERCTIYCLLDVGL